MAELSDLQNIVVQYEAELAVTIFSGIVALGFWAYALFISKRDRDPVPVLAMLGGGLCYFAEPIVDVLGNCFIPVNGQWILIDTFRQVPWFGLGVYMSFFGGTAFILARRFAQGMTSRQIWKFFFFIAAAEALWEPVPIAFNLWRYYGPQPFEVLGYPLWWAPVNAVGMMVPAVLIYKIRPYLSGPSVLLIVPLVLSGDLVGNAFTAWPVWSALQMDSGYLATYPAAILTCILSYVAVRAITIIVAADARRVSGGACKMVSSKVVVTV